MSAGAADSHAEKKQQLQNNAKEFQKPDRVPALPVLLGPFRKEHFEQNNKTKYNDFDLRYRHNITSVSPRVGVQRRDQMKRNEPHIMQGRMRIPTLNLFHHKIIWKGIPYSNAHQ